MMNKHYHFSFKRLAFGVLLIAMLFSANSFSQCTTGNMSGNNFTPTYTGNIELIQSSLPGGTYNIVNVIPNKSYTFISANASSSTTGYSGYITITDNSGTVVYANGNSPLQWSSGNVTGVTRFYVHNNAACATSSTQYRKSLMVTNSACLAPSGLNVSGINSTGVTLNWTPGATLPGEFQYFLSTSATMPQNTVQQLPTGYLSPTATNFTINTLLAGTTYHWWLRSSCNFIPAVWISGGNFTTPATACAQPTSALATNMTTSSATISWTTPASAPANGYEYYLSTTNTAPTVTSGTAVAGTTKNLTGLVINTTYFWWVRSICSSTVHSQWVQGTIFLTGSGFNCTTSPYGMHPTTVFTPSLCNATPEAISSTAWAGEYSNVNIQSNKDYTFSSSVSSDYLTITNEAGTVLFASGQTPVTWSSGTNTGVISYYLHGNAACATQQISRTKYITCATPGASNCNFPGAPFVTSVTNINATLSWTAPTSGAPSNGYQYLYRTSSTNPSPSETPSGSTTGLTKIISGLTPSTTYYYWVRSNCGTLQSSWRGGSSFTTGATNASCGQPYGLTPSLVGTTNATISWTAPATAPENGYHYYYAGSFTPPVAATTPSGNSTATTKSLSGLISGVTYNFWVRSYCASGAGNWIYGGSFTTLGGSGPCNPPINPVASNITPTSVTLSWTPPNPPPALGYDMIINTTGTAPLPSGNVISHANDASAHYSGFSPTQTYFWWVRSYCNDTSSWVYGGTFTTTAILTCNTANLGLEPAATFTPACNGTSELIGGNCHAGEFSNVSITANRTYTFTSSTSTDYLTITNAAGTAVYAFGPTPLVWNSGTHTGVIRYYQHTNSSCQGDGNTLRARRITCSGGATPITGCTTANHGLWPEETFTPAYTGIPEMISDISYASEYSNVNIMPNKQYVFSSSIATDYITITNADGTVIYASGNSPLSWSSAVNTGTIRYFFHTNSSCGDQSEPRVKYIKASAVLGIGLLEMESFTMYPNPVTDRLKIINMTRIEKIEITNFIGQSVIKQTINAAEAEIDLSGLVSGTYLLKAFTAAGTKTVKVVKK